MLIAEPSSNPAGVASLGISSRCQWNTRSACPPLTGAEYITRLKSGSSQARRSADSVRIRMPARSSISSSATSPNDPWWNAGAIHVSNGDPAAHGSSEMNPPYSSTTRSPEERSAAITSS